uniref:PE-PGRS family protein n=1 Tax=Steinernema glaseri TaxID=37863 RepID=A0A1I7Z8C7_9BILA
MVAPVKPLLPVISSCPLPFLINVPLPRSVVEDRALQAAGIALHAAGVEGAAAAVGVGTVQQQCAIAVFHQAAVAADHPVQGQVVAAAQGQLRGQADGVAQLQVKRAVQLRSATHRKRAAAQCSVVAQGQAAGIEARAALVGVGAGQGQVGRTVLHQAAAAADEVGEIKVIAARDGQRTAERHGVAQGHGLVGIQRGAVGSRQRTAAQGGVAAHHQRAAVELGAAGIAVVAVEHQGAAFELGQGAAAVDVHVQRGAHAVADTHVAGALGTVGEVQRVTAQHVAIVEELQAVDGLHTIDGHRAARALEHREGAVPGLVERSVGIGPVGAAD